MKWKLAFVALCVALLAPGVSSAATLDFATGNGGAGGTIIDLGGGNAMGSGIFIDSLTVTVSGVSTVYDVDGVACGTNGSISCGVLSFDTTSSDKFIKITGSVPSLSVGSTDLFAGSMATWSFTPSAAGAAFLATGSDVKDPALLSALNIKPGTPFNFIGVTIGFVPEASCGPNCYVAINTSFLNTPGVGENAVPEPGTLMLIGGGLLGLVRARRRVA